MTTTDNAVVLYQTPDGATTLSVHLEKDTVWLTQKQMAELFGKTVPTINEHIKNVFKEGELKEAAVIRNFRIAAADGKHTIPAITASTLSSPSVTESSRNKEPAFDSGPQEPCAITLSKDTRSTNNASESRQKN